MKQVLAIAALALPVAASAQGITCQSARLALEMKIPVAGGALNGMITVTKAAKPWFQVPAARVRDFSSADDTVSFSAVDEAGAETVLKVTITKNEFNRYVGYMLYSNMQIGLVCTEQ